MKVSYLSVVLPTDLFGGVSRGAEKQSNFKKVGNGKGALASVGALQKFDLPITESKQVDSPTKLMHRTR